MKLLIELDEEYVKAIDNIKFLVGGRTDRKLQLEIIKAIKNGKTLDQEPRRGHWIYDYTSADGHKTYHCSECGCYLKPKHSEPLNSFKWCSLCGADMRGNTVRKGEPIEGNNESYNCENWIP